MRNARLFATLCLLVATSGLAAAAEDASTAVAAATPPKASQLLTKPGYTEVHRLPSPYATPAAVADANRLYAISNTTIATYERETGELLATASAETAEHLNSGYFHDGKIYAAHSNYPKMPHESDIRVFDPELNTLKVHHTFTDPPGSLVWCVRRDGRWWCCFAWYGDDNVRTVLIEYADDSFTTEVRRFRFPPEVVADFAGMSASGGIWDGDTILASHHHYPVLYRLRLPADPEVTVLELVETLACPFPGQGIAVDPATPGRLVGIDRGGRAIVVAKPVTSPSP